MNSKPNSYFRSATCCIFVFCFYVLLAASTVQAAPVVVQATTSSPNGTLKEVVLNAGGTATLNTAGTAAFEYNNMGWRSADGLLWAVELIPTGTTGKIVRIDPSTGLLVDSKLSPTGLTLASGIRWDAGDVNNELDVLYISFIGAPGFNLYTLDLNTQVLTSKLITAGTGTGNAAGAVNDWAYNPDNNLLYGGDLSAGGQISVLNPATGERRDWLSADLVSGGNAFGAAWYDPNDGLVYLYNNGGANGTIYQINPGDPFASTPVTPTVLTSWTAAASPLNDGAYVVPIPGAALLLASGLIGLIAFRRRKQA